MKSNSLRAIVGGLILGVCAVDRAGAADTRPAPPAGFHWQSLEAIKASILAPDGWKLRHETVGETEAYFISRDGFDQAGNFATGLSLNCLRHVSAAAHTTPSAYIDAYTARMDKEHPVIDARTNETGPFALIWFEVVIPQPGAESTHMKCFLAGNDTTDTAYILQFEAPEKEWKKAYEAGIVMLKNVSLNTGY